MKKTLTKILKADSTTSFAFPVTYVDEEGVTNSYTVFSNETFRQIVKQLFGCREYNDWDPESDDSELLADFAQTFSTWKTTRQDTYGRRMYALSIKFNPLENYNGTEHSERHFTHGESVELSFDDRKDIRKDDSFSEQSYENYKETTKDDSYVERTFDNYKETTTDDSYVEHTFDQYKETTKDDSKVTRTYDQYHEDTTIGAQTTTNKVSADDVSTFSNRTQTEVGSRSDDKDISGSYTDQNGFTSLGVEKSTTGSYKEENGYENGLEKSIAGGYKDQNGFDTLGNEKAITGKIKTQHGQTLDGIVDEKVGTETTAHTGTDDDIFDMHKSGNLGVTTSQQMIASDLDLLKYDIAMMAIREFVSTYTYISQEVE